MLLTIFNGFSVSTREFSRFFLHVFDYWIWYLNVSTPFASPCQLYFCFIRRIVSPPMYWFFPMWNWSSMFCDILTNFPIDVDHRENKIHRNVRKGWKYRLFLTVLQKLTLILKFSEFSSNISVMSWLLVSLAYSSTMSFLSVWREKKEWS